MRSLRKTETDQYIINTAIRELQNQSTGAIVPLANGGTATALVDPDKDRFMMWDDTAGVVKFVPLADITTEGAPAAGDFVLVQRAEDEVVKVNWSSLPGFGGGLTNVSDDTSPTLGGNLEGNAFSLGTVGSAAADVFLESGGVINWNGGDVTITHSAGLLTVSDPVSLGANPLTCSTVELGNATDTTITKVSPGVAAIEGKNIYVAGGTDVALADGGTGATLADPGVDRFMFWDDSATAVKFVGLADITTEAAPAAGDFVLMQRAEDEVVKVNWNQLPGFTGGLSNVSDDTSPTLGGNLDCNTFSLGTVGSAAADLFLESGGVINWNSGDITVTHAANALDFAGGNFNFDSITLDAPLAVAQGGTGQITEAEALGEMIQALTEDTTPDFAVDFVATYDSSSDTGKKVKLSTILMTDWNRVVKILDETLATSTVFQDDDILTFAVAANTKYAFRCRLFYNTPTAADFKWQFTGPATPTLVLICSENRHDNATEVDSLNSAFSTSNVVTSSTVGNAFIDINGIVHNAANAGNVTLQWAQNSSSGTTTVYAGSYLEWLTVA